MSIRNILSYPDPRLRTIAKPVESFDVNLQTLIDDMFQTMYAAKGVGLAATQIDEHIQLIVMDLSEEGNQPQVFINPVVTPLVEEQFTYEEGCLSVPDYYDKVDRPKKVKINAKDREGNDFELEAEGLLAVCIQHEIDHLNGKLFVDYLSKLKQDRARDRVRKVIKQREKEAQHKQM
ncbi:peptide deformylase [Moraxella macacae 0408225]|uniref:Peptide deformylase n=1 Tax=Moraxella macacae 0408225 TaxID=1230338 RepID=L2F7W8_9GAMM|nr:peptide deformylase [Moraxella macacae]ELA09154.1 peptide deformylase [Moraxella macacae 0408225]